MQDVTFLQKNLFSNFSISIAIAILLFGQLPCFDLKYVVSLYHFGLLILFDAI